MGVIYLPMTADVITPGHVKAIQFCAQRGTVIIGLLTKKALEGYKNPVMTYLERKEILDSIKGVEKVVPQINLNCSMNLFRYHVNYLASGDGFEEEEKKSARLAGCKLLNVTLHGEEKEKLYSSTELKKRIWLQQKSKEEL